MTTTYLYTFCLSFAVGIGAATLFNFGIFFPLFLYIIAITIFAYALMRRASRSSKIFIVCFALFVAGLGAIRLDISNIESGSQIIDSKLGEKISVEGVIRDEPDERQNNTRYILHAETFEGEGVDQKILLIADRVSEFAYGDKVSVEGKIEKPEAFEDDRGEVFDYPAYLAKDAIFYEVFYPKISLRESGHGNPVVRWLFSLKHSFMDHVRAVIPEPQASLLGGLVLGAKHSLGDELMEKFRQTGIVHIVVLSGYNLTIVADFLMKIFSFLPQVASISVGAFSIVLFAIMVGGSATVVRASVMALLGLLARATGRTYAITRALFIAGFLMLLHNPKILVHDVSFQLSFMATLGLIWLSPIVGKYFEWIPQKLQLREVATATISTQIFVLPILLYQMGQLSLVSLPVNLLVLPLIPLTMLFGFLAGVAGFISTIISIPFAYIAHFLLSYTLFIVDIFSSIPFASVSIHYFPLWLVVLYYVGLGFFIYKKNIIPEIESKRRSA